MQWLSKSLLHNRFAGGSACVIEGVHFIHDSISADTALYSTVICTADDDGRTPRCARRTSIIHHNTLRVRGDDGDVARGLASCFSLPTPIIRKDEESSSSSRPLSSLVYCNATAKTFAFFSFIGGIRNTYK